MISGVFLPQKMLVQMHDCPANFCLRVGLVTGHHIRFDIREEKAFPGFAAEVQNHIPAGYIIGHDPLDSPHRSTRIAYPFGDGF